MSMTSCPQCKSMVYEGAPICPHCDLRLKPRSPLWLLAWILPIGAAVAWWLW